MKIAACPLYSICIFMILAPVQKNELKNSYLLLNAAKLNTGILTLLGGSMLISAGCTFLLFLSFSQSAIIALQCLFCGVSAAAWNGIEVVTVELYPASKR